MTESATRAYVYVVAWDASGPVKIGVATSVRPRLSSMQTGCPFKLYVHCAVRVVNAYKLEKHMHATFWDRALEGEWFDVEPANAIEALEKAAAIICGDYTHWRPDHKDAHITSGMKAANDGAPILYWRAAQNETLEEAGSYSKGKMDNMARMDRAKMKAAMKLKQQKRDARMLKKYKF